MTSLLAVARVLQQNNPTARTPMTSNQPSSDAKVIIGYVRVSRARQSEVGASLDRQEDAIRTFADHMNTPVL